MLGDLLNVRELGLDMPVRLLLMGAVGPASATSSAPVRVYENHANRREEVGETPARTRVDPDAVMKWRSRVE